MCCGDRLNPPTKRTFATPLVLWVPALAPRARDFSPVQMIGQRQRQAVAQRRFGNLLIGIKDDASVAAIGEFVRV
jgi:hypothetical protein